MRILWFNLSTDEDAQSLAFATHWINAMATLVDGIDVITMKAGCYRLRENVTVYSVGKEKGFSKPRRVIEFYHILLRLLWRTPYDACFAHMIPLFALMAAPLLKMKKVPITLWYAHKSVTLTLKLAEKMVDRVVTPSRESFRLSSSKVIITGHGIDTALFIPAKESQDCKSHFIISSIGRIAPVKNIDILVEAIRVLSYKLDLSKVRVRLVGASSDRDLNYAVRIKERIAKYQLNGIIEMVGPVPFRHIVREYQAADVVVNLSDTGSIDKAVLEAMSCGVPVITSNEAFQETLDPWLDLLYLKNATAADLADKLLKLIAKSAEVRQKIGKQLRRIVVQEHSLESLVRKLAYDVLVAK